MLRIECGFTRKYREGYPKVRLKNNFEHDRLEVINLKQRLCELQTAIIEKICNWNLRNAVWGI